MKRWSFLWILPVALCFCLAVSRVERQRRDAGRQQLETLVRRTAVSCYAAEGFYPPSVDYMCRNWGLTFSREDYIVHYECIASNLMPQITVLEKQP